MKLLMFPGLDGTGRLFEPTIACCPPGIRPAPIPLPNHEHLNYSQLVRELLPLMNQPEPFFILGESYSGPLVLKLASMGSDNLRGIILVNTFVRPPYPSWLHHFSSKWLFSIHPPRWAIRLVLVDRKTEPSLLELVNNVIGRLPSGLVAKRVKDVLTCDASTELISSPVPILCLRSDHDRLVGPKSTERMLRLRPDLILKTPPGPHLVLQTAPEPCWNAIQLFMLAHFG